MKPKRLLLCVFSALSVAVPLGLSLPHAPTLAQFEGEEQTNIAIYQKVSPTVVTIKTGRSEGSGTIVSPEGLILTNQHVILGSRSGRVSVTTATGKNYAGEAIASDARNDLALVRLITKDRFPTVALADEDGIQVGQRVYAIGSPFGLSGTFTTGILSRIAKNGDLQTDAALNPGNSGGPLLNSRGELIGVNKAILSPDRRGNIGIGFATSVLTARDFIAQNRDKQGSGAIAGNPSSQPPRLGVTVDSSLVIRAVEQGSLAERVGLKPGDSLVAINGRRIRESGEVLQFLNTRPDSAVLTVLRNRRLANVRVNF